MHNRNINKIVSPTVLPQADNTLSSWAEQLSNLFQAQLILYNAVPTQNADLEQNTPRHISENNQLFKSAMIRLRTLGRSLQRAYKVRYIVEMSNKWQALIRQVTDESADLLIAPMPDTGSKTPGWLSATMYNSPCPVFFVRPGMAAYLPSKILLPLGLDSKWSQHTEGLTNWARTCGSTISLAIFVTKHTSPEDRLKLYKGAEEIVAVFERAGVKVESETVQGYHSGTAVLQHATLIGADMIAIEIEPLNYLSRLFNKMIGPFFLENSQIPVLSIPVTRKVKSEKVLEVLAKQRSVQVA